VTALRWPARISLRCAASRAATATSVAVTWSQRWASRSVNTPIEQPGSNACR
jgi:hypothetical protein